MSCDPGEEARVEALAVELDGTIRALKERIGEIGDRRLAVMAALMVLDRLKIAEDRVTTLTAENARLERARERAALAAEADDEPLIARIDAATAAIERLTAEITVQVRSSQAEAVPVEGSEPTFSRTPRRTPPAPPPEEPGATEDAAPSRSEKPRRGENPPTFARRP